ncbi:MAG: TRAP transporter small permease subunit [Rhodobacterales bacterium]|nr:TRAP transporter small permease subunit [Rhodobacterales bacterium]
MSDTSGEREKDPRVEFEAITEPTELPRTRFSEALDGFVQRVGNLASWVWVLLVAVIVVNVTMRYAFGRGYIAFEEAQWHLYSVGWMVGLAYCVQNDNHIRIDILHEGFRPRTKAWIDFLGILLFLIPYVAIVLIYSPNFIQYSFSTGEISDAPGGLPFRWAIKSLMFFSFLLLLVAALARLARAWAGVRAYRRVE